MTEPHQIIGFAVCLGAFVGIFDLRVGFLVALSVLGLGFGVR